ncbi:MAG: glycosyltransferase family 4 protein [Candidatus Sericytochromatia bacterium]|nr:glycosyltransferase family 4 protein [Candidatus Sericytochromatia bacterium]
MKIVWLSQHFAPEPCAPAARGLEMARVWREAGHTVKVVTAFPNHPQGVVPEGYRGRWRMREDLDGLAVYRSWVYVTPNEGFFKRILNHLSFTASAVLQTLPRLGEVDVVVASSPSFFPVLAAWLISRVKGVPFVFEVRDLWPGIFKALGVLRDGPALRALEALERWLYHQADHVVTVTQSFAADLRARGVPAHKLSVITNGVDLDQFAPAPRHAARREAWGVANRFVVLYLGTHGISQGLETHLAAARLLQDDPEVAFVFVGEGARKQALMAEAAELPNVQFHPAVPKAEVPACYHAADVCLVPLRDLDAFGQFIPSKLFELLGCARPIIASLTGEPAALLEASGAATVVPPGDVAALVAAIRQLKQDPAREVRAQQGRAFVAQHYDRRVLATRYLDLLEGLVARRRGVGASPERAPALGPSREQAGGEALCQG